MNLGIINGPKAAIFRKKTGHFHPMKYLSEQKSQTLVLKDDNVGARQTVPRNAFRRYGSCMALLHAIFGVAPHILIAKLVTGFHCGYYTYGQFSQFFSSLSSAMAWVHQLAQPVQDVSNDYMTNST